MPHFAYRCKAHNYWHMDLLNVLLNEQKNAWVSLKAGSYPTIRPAAPCAYPWNGTALTYPTLFLPPHSCFGKTWLLYSVVVAASGRLVKLPGDHDRLQRSRTSSAPSAGQGWPRQEPAVQVSARRDCGRLWGWRASAPGTRGAAKTARPPSAGGAGARGRWRGGRRASCW